MWQKILWIFLMRPCCNKTNFFLRRHPEQRKAKTWQVSTNLRQHLFWWSGLNSAPVQVNADVFKPWITGCNSWMEDIDEKFDDFSFDRLFFTRQSKTEWPVYHLLDVTVKLSACRWLFKPLFLHSSCCSNICKATWRFFPLPRSHPDRQTVAV